MRHIATFLLENGRRSFTDWQGDEAVSAFVLAVVVVGGSRGVSVFALSANELQTAGVIVASLLLALSVLRVVVVTPAKMWDEAGKKIKERDAEITELKVQIASKPSGPTGIALSGDAKAFVFDSTFTQNAPQRGDAPDAAEDTASWLGESHIANRSLGITDLVSGMAPAIEGRTFENCTLYGPAILGLVDKVTFDQCTFAGPFEETWWPLSGRGTVIGAVPVKQTIFRRCHLVGIGLTGPDAIAQKFLSNLQR